MIEFLFTHKSKYFSGEGLNYKNALSKVGLKPDNFPKKELLCIFVQEPTQKESEEICADFSIDKFYLQRYRNEKRSLRYSFDPLIFTLTDYFTINNKIRMSHLLFVIKKNVLILIVSKKDAYYQELFENVIELTKRRRLKSEAYILYEFLQKDTKENYDVIELLDDQISKLEKKIIHEFSGEREALEEILSLKKELINLNKRLWASSKIIFTIKKDLTSIKLNTEERALLDDIYDTLMHQIDLVETQKGNVTDFLEIFTTQISNKLSKTSNELNMIMKKMAALTIIIMVPTLIAGIYGTNFANLPEIHWKYGYFYMIGLMIIAAYTTYALFHKKNWV
jgi:magnesium transporter